ncbi:MAG: TraR/DksA family transcriptional regulator [Inquilinaceae bacterium]
MNVKHLSGQPGQRPDLDAVKALLLARRDELQHLDEGAEATRDPIELDQTRVGRLSRMDALQVQAMALETRRRREVELARIDAAFERIDAGTYGDCTHCGEPIAPARLDADPTTPLCVNCVRSAGAR